MGQDGQEPRVQPPGAMVTARMVITLLSDGRVNVEGIPANNPVLAYGMLDTAREVIHEFRRRGDPGSRVITPVVGLPPL